MRFSVEISHIPEFLERADNGLERSVIFAEFVLRAKGEKSVDKTIDVAKKIADALEVSTDSLIYGSNEQIVNNKLNDEELLQLFNKVQQLSDENITSVKAMLKAFVFQKDIQKQLA